MSDDSVDKRRIKFTGFDDEKQVKQFPLKLLVLSEFSPRDIQTGASLVSERMPVDNDNINEVVAKLGAKVALNIPNRLSDEPKEVIIDLPLQDINSFRPESIAENIPVLKGLLEVRNVLTDLRDHKLSQEEFQDRLDRSAIGTEMMSKIRSFLATPKQAMPSEPKPEQRADKGEALGDLFDIIDTTETPTAPVTAKGALDRVISLFVSPKKGEPIDARSVNSAIAELDGLLGSQINEVIHHKEFRRLESSWRGLRFLLSRTNFRENIQVEVMSVPRGRLRDVFHEKIYQPEYENVSDSPISAVIADYEFGNSAHDIESLLALATDAEAIQVPFISSVGADFFGIDHADQINELPYLGEVFRQSEFIKWNGLRESETSRWLTMTLNRFLLRLPYGKENRVKGFNFQETVSSYLWGNPVWGLGTLMTSSFAKLGWATEITGTRNGAVEDLPVREYRQKSGEMVYIPLETVIPAQRYSDLADNGITALTCRINFDSAFVLSAPTVHLPEMYPDSRMTEKSMFRATLPYQLFAARIANFVGFIRSDVLSGGTAQEVEARFKTAIARFVSVGGRPDMDAVSVRVTQNADRPNYHDIVLKVRPSREILGGGADIELGFQARI